MGNDYEITGTKSNDRYVKNCIDTVKNLTNGKTKNFKRFELIAMLKRYEL